MTEATVTIVHPEIEGSALTTAQAFKQVWEPRGWEVANPVVVAAGRILGVPVVDLEDLDKQALMTVGAQLGVTLSAGDTKAAMVKAINKEGVPVAEAAVPVDTGDDDDQTEGGPAGKAPRTSKRSR